VTDVDLRLNETLDMPKLIAAFEQQKRTQVRKILPKECAVRIHNILARETPWQYTYFDGQRNNVIPLKSYQDMDPEKRQSVADAVNLVAQKGFAYSYQSFNFHQKIFLGELKDHPLCDVDAMLNSDEFLEFARRLVGDSEISGSDATASCYGPGHFLNIHDDQRPGYDLRAAFVLNLSPLWRIDWGGELKFFSNRRGSELEGAYFPAFNVLNIFAVPKYHSVGPIANFAGASRYSISGWLYAGEAPYS